MRSFRSVWVTGLVIAMVPATVSAQVGAGQNQQLLLGTRPATDARKPAGQLDTLNDLRMALRYCWKPPGQEYAHAGMRMTMRFSLNRDGRMIGPPMVTYATPEVSPRTREIYRESMLKSLEACLPFPFTAGLAGAIAGRPIVVWIVDDRDDAAVKPRV